MEGARRNGIKDKTGRQKWRQWGAICWPKGERTRRFERDTFSIRHQMQYKKPAFQSPRNRLRTPKPPSPAHHSSQFYTSHGDDRPAHYQLQRTPTSTMLGISAVVHLLKLCPNYVSANSGRTRRCPCLKVLSAHETRKDCSIQIMAFRIQILQLHWATKKSIILLSTNRTVHMTNFLVPRSTGQVLKLTGVKAL